MWVAVLCLSLTPKPFNAIKPLRLGAPHLTYIFHSISLLWQTHLNRTRFTRQCSLHNRQRPTRPSHKTQPQTQLHTNRSSSSDAVYGGGSFSLLSRSISAHILYLTALAKAAGNQSPQSTHPTLLITPRILQTKEDQVRWPRTHMWAVCRGPSQLPVVPDKGDVLSRPLPSSRGSCPTLIADFCFQDRAALSRQYVSFPGSDLSHSNLSS